MRNTRKRALLEAAALLAEHMEPVSLELLNPSVPNAYDNGPELTIFSGDILDIEGSDVIKRDLTVSAPKFSFDFDGISWNKAKYSEYIDRTGVTLTSKKITSKITFSYELCGVSGKVRRAADISYVIKCKYSDMHGGDMSWKLIAVYE